MKTYETGNGVEEYIKMCEGYDNSKFKALILKHLNKNSSILEVGMGSGNDLKWLSEHYSITGSDYSKEFINRAKIRFPKNEFKILDAITLKTNKKYDGIYSCKVYQHFELELVEKALIRQSEMLNAEGIIIHSFWIGDTIFDDGDMHAIYHNKDKLLSLINKHFILLEQVVYEEFEPNDSIFILAKQK
jgi:cyclopropane fatty-acyl-phospholipid synthase-like methyltransferase